MKLAAVLCTTKYVVVGASELRPRMRHCGQHAYRVRGEREDHPPNHRGGHRRRSNRKCAVLVLDKSEMSIEWRARLDGMSLWGNTISSYMTT